MDLLYVNVGPLDPLKAKSSSSSSLDIEPLWTPLNLLLNFLGQECQRGSNNVLRPPWHSLAPFGMDPKLSAKAPFGTLGPIGG